MKRFTFRYFPTYSKPEGYNRLRTSNEVEKEGNTILHFSYNLTLDAEQDGFRRLSDKGYSVLSKNDAASKSQRSSLEIPIAKTKQSTENLTYKQEDSQEYSKTARTEPSVFYSGGIQGFVQERSTEKAKSLGISEAKSNRAVALNGRKCGLGETSNVSLMSHKLRKKAVCETTDNSHYQRQFLRVLNKRF